MLDADHRRWLADRFPGQVLFDEPMGRHTTLAVGGSVDAMVFPETAEATAALVADAWERRRPYLVMGGGSNLLVGDGPQPLLVVNLCRMQHLGDPQRLPDGRLRLHVAAGVSTRRLCRFCLQNGFRGMNFAVGIPGTVGGAIRMNAGTGRQWMSDVLAYVDVLYPLGAVQRVAAADFDAGYRRFSWGAVSVVDQSYPPVILAGGVDLSLAAADVLRREAGDVMRRRVASQPVCTKSAGCFYKNPSTDRSAGQLIDLAGLKGLSRGGVVVSEKHGNFIVNTGRATAADFLAVMRQVEETVWDRFGIRLEPEVRIVEAESKTDTGK